MCLTLFACFACSPPEENEQTETDTCYVTIEETDGVNIDVGGKYILTKGDSLTVKLVPESGYKAEKAVYKDSAGNHEINASQLTDNTVTIHCLVRGVRQRRAARRNGNFQYRYGGASRQGGKHQRQRFRR